MATEMHPPVWKNSSQTLTAHPDQFVQVASADALVSAVQAAVDSEKKIRVTGGHHSWYPLVMSDKEPDGGSLPGSEFVMIDVSQMKAITKEEDGHGGYLVHAEPGATMGDLEAATMGNWPDAPAPPPLVALTTNGVIPTELQLGGFVSAGCHGTGWEQPTVPDLVEAIEIVVVDKNGKAALRKFTAAYAEEMAAVRVHLGTIGAIARITFRAVALYSIHGIDDVKQPMPQVVSRTPSPSDHPLKNLVENNDYVELFWFPFNATKLENPANALDLSDLRMVPDMEDTRVWVKTGNVVPNVDGAPAPPKNVPSQGWDALASKFGSWAYTEVAKKLSGGVIDYGLAEGLLWSSNHAAYKSAAANFVAPATRFFHYQKSAFPVLDLSMAVPMDAETDPFYETISKAWYAAVDAIVDWARTKEEYYQRFPVNVTLHARFTKNSQSLLSPAYQPEGSDVHTCWIEFVSGAPTPDAPGESWYDNYMSTWAAFCREVGKTWLDLGGRPHWAKEWQLLEPEGVYDRLPELYGSNLSKFKTIRDELDPTETFLFPWTAKIFGQS
ncbi:D-arabinono-1,4-lactone oxidase [Ruegeria sp. EL01]|jgi:FAD/FMN-containing dehydrogenase|uniref:D-arabinono-1,4-lactone oxidase n=1 Tax=Ruegeria sp. EL01 TaxID=2107578 RepID=UPI000EA7F5B8|nr:D-arabinono-1,4-lactone oxidase [Ruegeria sp. EL01]